MARSTVKTQAEAPDLMKALLEELANQGVKPKVKWAPSKSYAAYRVGR